MSANAGLTIELLNTVSPRALFCHVFSHYVQLVTYTPYATYSNTVCP